MMKLLLLLGSMTAVLGGLIFVMVKLSNYLDERKKFQNDLAVLTDRDLFILANGQSKKPCPERKKQMAERLLRKRQLNKNAGV
jgi:hypothetical protein